MKSIKLIKIKKMDTASTPMNKKASAKRNGDNSDSDDDDDASKIVRENNHVYF